MLVFREKIVITVLVVLFVVIVKGCYHAHAYYYINLEDNKNIKVLKRGKNKAISFHRTMPIHYELKRNLYTVRFEIPQQDADIGHLLYIYVDSKNGLSVKGKKSFCSSWSISHKKKVSNRARRFFWLIEERQCNKKNQKNIVFQVINLNGEVLGTESIPFKIRMNGYYIAMDVW